EHDATRSAVIDELDVRGGLAITVAGALLQLDPTPGSAFDTARTAAIRAAVDGGTDGAAFRRLIDTADAVLVAGCSMSDAAPHLLFERAATLQLAAARELPVAMAGVAFGPRLTEGQRSVVGDALSTTSVIGVLDGRSQALAAALGASATVQPHDGAFLRGTTVEAELPAEYVALVVHAFAGAGEAGPLRSLAAFVRDIHRVTALPVVVFPTTGAVEGPSDSAADVGLAGLLTSTIADPAVLIAAPLLPARELATACRSAAAIVSTRVLPLALAVTAGVPALAITTDTAGHAPLGAALGYGGLASWQVPLSALAGAAGAERFAELWARRAEISAHLTELQPAMRTAHQRRWDHVHAVLTGRSGTAKTAEEWAPASVASRVDLSRYDLLDELHRGQLTHLHDAFDGAEQYALSLRELVGHRETEVRDLRARVAELEGELAERFAEQTRLMDEARDSRTAAQAAQRLNASLGELSATQGERSRVAMIEQYAASVQREIDALHATILFRSMRFPRRVYARLRRLVRVGAAGRRAE
ncbi:MAG: hypothetical protein ABMA25_18165, partial [Ilumatobacteraceae bacterium]